LTILDIAPKEIIPAIIAYKNLLVKSYTNKINIGLKLSTYLETPFWSGCHTCRSV
jgi:hypothetical protein